MPHLVGVRFAHASLQVLAEDHGIDLLHIKGPAVHDDLLEVRQGGDAETGEARIVVPRQSVDADILVRPSQVELLFGAMRRHGWSTAFHFEDGSAFEHAATMVHDTLEHVDVHRRFPGIGLAAEAAFDRLWADRGTARIAGIDCWVPSVTAQRLLLILHAIRGGAGEDHPDIRRTWGDASDADRAAVQRLADELRAEVPLAAATGRLEDYRNHREYQLWRLLARGDYTLPALWLARVRAAPTPWAALRTGVRMVLPNPHRMEQWLGRRPTARDLAHAYRQRLALAVVEVGKLVRRARSGGRR